MRISMLDDTGNNQEIHHSCFRIVRVPMLDQPSANNGKHTQWITSRQLRPNQYPTYRPRGCFFVLLFFTVFQS